MSSIIIVKPLFTILRSSVNKSQQHRELILTKNLRKAKNQTCGSGVRSTNATSAPPFQRQVKVQCCRSLVGCKSLHFLHWNWPRGLPRKENVEQEPKMLKDGDDRVRWNCRTTASSILWSFSRALYHKAFFVNSILQSFSRAQYFKTFWRESEIQEM